MSKTKPTSALADLRLRVNSDRDLRLIDGPGSRLDGPELKRLVRSACFLPLVLLSLSACAWPGRLARGYAEAEPQGLELIEEGGAWASAPAAIHGQVRFLFDDFGSLTTDGLQTYAIPWKLAAAALVRSRHESEGAPLSLATLRIALAEYGFITPRRIMNWEGAQPRLEYPMGLVSGVARRGFPAVEIEIANVGCATCHAGPLYGADGLRTPDAWLGLPNASIDLTAYANDVFLALRRDLDRPDTLLAAVAAVFPRVSDRELTTLRKHVIPKAREQLAWRAEHYGGLLPYENGGPGLMNALASRRFLLGELETDARRSETAWASAPDLAGTTMRRSLLVDGAYAEPGSSRFGDMTLADVTPGHLDDLAGVVSLFVSGTQGVTPARARDAIPAVRDIMRFIHTMQPPSFPGAIDTTLAGAGRRVYEEACAACHGTYAPGLSDARLVTHPNRLVPQDRMLTDSVRWASADSALLGFIDRVGYGEHIEPMASSGYVAPDLSGVWATAPYLHNGSIPTLWHLLHPEERPTRFYVGGHALDYELMGIAGRVDAYGTYRYPEGYEPWSRPVLYDTREPGRSNQGHGFRTLSEADKRAILEYMKVL